MGDRTVLVVDGERASAQALEQTLGRMGFTVVGLAYSGEEAIEMAVQTRPDVVLLDLHLAGRVDGADAAAGIRAALDIPLVYRAAEADERLWKRARAAGPYAYVAKPCQDVELRAALDVALSQHQAVRQLKQRERWLATTLDSIGDAVLSADEKGMVSSMNPRAEALTGWRQEDGLGKGIAAILGFAEEGGQAAADRAATRRLHKDILVRFAEGTLVARDGRRVPVEYSSAPIRDARGNVAGSVWVLRDTTERKHLEAQLEERRLYLEAVLGCAPDALVTLDPERRIREWNQGAERLFGYSAQEAIGRSLDELVAGPETTELERARDLAQQVLAGEPFPPTELTRYRKDGTAVDVIKAGSPIWLDEKLIGAVASYRDISERKQAERRLRDTNELLERVFATTHLLIAYMDAEFNFLRVNRAYAAADGREPESFVGENHFDLYPNDENEAIFRRVVETGEPASFRAKPFEYTAHPERGVTHWDWDLVPVKDAQGEVQGLVLSLVEVTQRIQAEQELREERDFAQALIETAQTIVLVMDTEGRIVHFNPYLEEISGYSLQDVQGKDWFATFLPQRDQDGIRELFLQAVGDTQTRGNVNPIVTKDGQEREIEWYDKTLKDGVGNVVGLLAIGQDVTERRQAQAALQEMHAQLEQRVAERTRELATLYDVTALASQSLDLQVTLQHSLGRLLEAMPCGCGALHLLDRSDGLLRLAAQQGLSPVLVDQLAALPADTGALGSMLAQGQPVVISDLASHSLGDLAPAAKAFAVCVGAPMRARGATVGVLHVFGRADEQCSVEDLALLTSVADHVGIAVDNAWLQQRAEQAAVLEERERLGRELHDSITQVLFGLTLYAELARDMLESGEWDRAAEELVRIQATAHQVLKDTRLLVYRMRPVMLEEAGLVEALRVRMAAVESREGIEAQVVADVVGQLPARVEEGFYYTAQEALNNAFRHAQASSVTVSIRSEGQHFVLEVVDNGCGFDPQAVPTEGGMGLGNMRQRVEELGGALTILSEPGRGTIVRARVGLAGCDDRTAVSGY